MKGAPHMTVYIEACCLQMMNFQLTVCLLDHKVIQQSISRGRWALKRIFMELVSHLGKKLLLPGLLDVMLYELDMEDPQKMTAEVP
ncbi:hypothetical protein LEMLEM_LOCUS24248 [Lemmus lemmus]